VALSDREQSPTWLSDGLDAADFLHAVLAEGIEFVQRDHGDDKFIRYASEKELIRTYAQALPSCGSGLDSLLEDFKQLCRDSIHQGHKRYLAFPDAASSLAAAAASMLSDLLNQNLIAFDRSAPAATIIEHQVLQWIRELLGYDFISLEDYENLSQVGGMWTSGGNMSNHIAIAAAIRSRWPEVAKVGMRGIDMAPKIVLASGVEHFSYASAVQVLGLGTDALSWANSGPDLRSDPKSLKESLENAGPAAFMLVGVAGNCRTTGLDDLHALADLAEEFGVWFHVDACHGGSLLFSSEYRARLAGIERADSVSLDPHKGLFINYPSSYVMFRDGVSLSSFSRYPSKSTELGVMDLGLITPFYGSRGGDSIKLWALIKHLGIDGIAAAVGCRAQGFKLLCDGLVRTGSIRLLSEPDFYRVPFACMSQGSGERIQRLAARRPDMCPALVSIVSEVNERFAEACYKSGTAAFDLFSLTDAGNKIGLGATAKFSVVALCVGRGDQTAEDVRGLVRDLSPHFAYTERLLHASLDSVENQLQVTFEQTSRSIGPAGW
jgi:glutamate/tyrosine decarboxylase-like PLP-dependent enzyme